MSQPGNVSEERILLLTPTGADAEVAASMLRHAGRGVTACTGIANLCEQVQSGAGAIVLSEEALITNELVVLIQCLSAQPAWSDIPLIVLTMRADDGHSTVAMTRLFHSVGNMVLLERPFQETVFLAMVDMALRSRRKQYQVRELLAREQTARSVAEHASRMKDEFLANVSHELRTPLNAILGWSRLVRRESISEEDRSHGLETIERNARAQTKLIEDLLDMSRIVSGKIRLDVQHVEPSMFVQAAIDTVRPAAEAKGIELTAVLDPLAGPVSGDPIRLQQVVWNLLSNAIKFTPKGGRVQVLLERVGSHVDVVISDSGQGIRPEFVDHVFERFRQADGSTTRQFGGLGIGLAIVKHLVELHGGSVRAISAGDDQGSTFRVSLPVGLVRTQAQRTPEQDVEGEQDRDQPSLAGMKILAVDDEKDARDLIAKMLSACGAEVHSSASAAEALEELAGFRADVLISDISMPGIDGYELLRRVRARGVRSPAIALTAFARTQDRTRALRAGFLAHVAKPVEPSELIATVASIAAQSQNQAARDRAPFGNPSAEPRGGI